MAGKDDETVLAWAAMRDRILLTHDVSTITAHAYRRVMGRPDAGRAAVEDVLLLTECSQPGEWEGQVRYLPLR